MVSADRVSVSHFFIAYAKIFFFSIILFLLLNQLSPITNLSFSSQRIAFVLIVLLNLAFIRRLPYRLNSYDLLIFLIPTFLLSYSLLVSAIYSTDLIQSSRFFHFVLFSLFGPFLVCRVLKDEVIFHKAIVVATIIQVVFVILTYSSSAFSDWLFSYIHSGSQALSGARAPGLSSSGGAALSVVLSLGSLSILRLSDFRTKTWHFSVLVLITCSAALVGRTGMLVSLICLFLLVFKGRVSIKGLAISSLFVGLLGFMAFDAVKSNPQFFGYTLSWALSVFTGADHTVTTLLGQDLRELNERILLFGGTGVSSPEGVNASGSDVGYIQTLYSIGLPFALVFYVTYFFYLCQINVDNGGCFFKWLLIFLVFLLELKEPFIFKYAISFYVLASLLYMRRAKVVCR